VCLSRGQAHQGDRGSSQTRATPSIISYDEKPGIQAIANTAPDQPPELGVHATFARDHEYKRHGTVSLLAGIDLLSGQVHALVRNRHRSCEFIEFLKLLDAAYPAHTRTVENERVLTATTIREPMRRPHGQLRLRLPTKFMA
jgi:hypothetical protein